MSEQKRLDRPELREKIADIWMVVFEIIEANVHQWQEKPTGKMPRVMTSVNTEKMREQLVSLFKTRLALIPDKEELEETIAYFEEAIQVMPECLEEEAKKQEPYGTDKGNSKENMAGIRSESQGLDRLRPGEMPAGVAVMDEQYLDKEGYEVTTEQETWVGESPHEGLFGIDMDWLNETLEEIRWTDETAISFLAKYNVSLEGTLVEVLSRLNREQAEDFTKTLQSKAGSL